MTQHNHIIQNIRDLKPGSHLCCIYETEAERRAILTPFITQGLRANHKVAYILTDREEPRLLEYLHAADVEPQPYLDQGQIQLLSYQEAYLIQGHFDPDRTLDFWREQTERALAEGYAALRITANMGWVKKEHLSTEQLFTYEAKLNIALPNIQAIAICQYNRQGFAASTLLDVLRTHPLAIVGTEVYDNFYYIPPHKFLSDNPSAAILEHWVKNLAERKETEQTLRQERDLLDRIMETSPAGITVVNRNGQITFANPRAEAVLHLSKDKLTQRTYNAPTWKITDLEGRPYPEENLPFNIVMRTKAPAYNIQHAIESPDGGERILLSINSAPLFNADGNVHSVINTLENITERTQAEKARIKQLRRELNWLENMSHLRQTSVTARAMGLTSLQESLPEHFEHLVELYAQLLDLTLEERSYKVQHNISNNLRALAEQLGTLNAGPRDVIHVHSMALKKVSQDIPVAKAQAYAEEGRYNVLELMGFLTAYYRTHAIG